MYRKQIEEYIDNHSQEMIEDIFTLCRIDSQKMPYEEGMPYGKGPARALIHGRQAARIAAGVAEKLQGAVHALAYQHEVRGVYGPQQQEYQPGDGCHGGGDESAL